MDQIQTESVVLDIGDDAGGLIFYTGGDLRGCEIEVAPAAYPDFKTHTQVSERLVQGRTLFAGVFPPIALGDYLVCRPPERAGQAFTVSSGHVTEIDWR